MTSILIVEDDITYSLMLKTWLTKKGHDVSTVSSVALARKAIEQKQPQLILSDLRLPDHDGIELLRWLTEKGYHIPFFMMTSYANIPTAVQAMKLGATDYIEKPVNPDILLQKISEVEERRGKVMNNVMNTPVDNPVDNPIENPVNNSVNKQVSKQMSKRKNSPIHNSAGITESDDYIEGESEAARHLYKYVRLVAPTRMSVLINGASGTGKEYVAHRIHQLSNRASGPFIAIDCGAIPKELAASEFFGHVKGAFTGAVTDKTGAFTEACGGTLFLDEVGNLSYEVQIQLLRAIQERKIRPVGSAKELSVDVRLICATNENLQAAIERGTFREDLYHRLNEFTLLMPRLQDRQEDIMPYAQLFLRQANQELDKSVKGFDEAATRCMRQYNWPGNLRQMKNVIRRATLLTTGDYITPDELAELQTMQPAAETRVTATAVQAASAAPVGNLQLRNEETEKQQILEALRQAGYNKSKAAQLLGIDRKTIYNKLKQYNL